MEMHATRTLAADRATVWAALNEAEAQGLHPRLRGADRHARRGFEAVVKQKVGPVKATFKGAVTLSDVVPGTSYTISGEGKGGVAGFAKGAAVSR
jgi:carbon monoxide dehydrogenase subunit G